MTDLINEFNESLKEYTGKNIGIFNIEQGTQRLITEFDEYIKYWLNPRFTGEVALDPINRIIVEIDSSGYMYSAVLSEETGCMISEGRSPNLKKWGLDTLHRSYSKLVAQFFAVCYQQALPTICESEAFQALPRASEIKFEVGNHSGWACGNVYTFKGQEHRIDYGNIKLLELAYKVTLAEPNNPLESTFLKHLENININDRALEFIPIFEEFISWLAEQTIEPLEFIALFWSSNFEKDTLLYGFTKDDKFRWNKNIEISSWFSEQRPADLELEECEDIRNVMSCKLAQIACLATEKIIDTSNFKKLNLLEEFEMSIVNLNEESRDIEFYPFY